MQAHIQNLQLLKEEERDGLPLNPSCLPDKAKDKSKSAKIKIQKIRIQTVHILVFRS